MQPCRTGDCPHTAYKPFFVTTKRIYSCILLFWALSLVASPLALLYMQDENVVLSLSSSGEEETGESGTFDTLQEKIIYEDPVHVAAHLALVKREAPRSCERLHRNHVCEILLPPPEVA